MTTTAMENGNGVDRDEIFRLMDEIDENLQRLRMQLDRLAEEQDERDVE